MDAVFNPENVYEFIKRIVELGGVHYIDNEHCIRATGDDSLVGIKVNDGANGCKKIALWKPNAPTPSNDTVLLNPFVESLGNYPEKTWFYLMMNVMPGGLLHQAIRGITELCLSKDKDIDHTKIAAVAKFVDRVDEKFLTEITTRKVRAVDLACIFYSREKHTAQLQSSLWDEEFAAKVTKSKLRKSSLALLRDMVESLLGTNKPETIMHRATLLGCPQMDATVHVLIDVVQRIAPVFELVTDICLHSQELTADLEQLAAYQKAMRWISSSTSSASSNSKPGTVEVVPWKTNSTSTIQAVTPTAPQPVAAIASVPSTPTVIGGSSGIMVAGTVVNPNFKQQNQVVQNPTYGQQQFSAPTAGMIIPAGTVSNPNAIPNIPGPMPQMAPMPMPGFCASPFGPVGIPTQFGAMPNVMGGGIPRFGW